MEKAVKIEVKNLNMSYNDYVVMEDLNFKVYEGSIFVIMGGSGCGKSTLLKYLLGLKETTEGDILYNGKSFVNTDEDERRSFLRKFGVLYQGGALWSSMTLLENVMLPLEEFTYLSKSQCEELAEYKLALVGLKSFINHFPSDISGGMRKRAGIARAMALDPEILFFDEPSAGLDPLTSRRLDDLILELKESLNTTIVVVTHELPSLFAIADDSIFLDPETKRAIAQGKPKELLISSTNQSVLNFLTRGEFYNKR